MAGLQRSSVSFRRQGSSGLVWEERFLQTTSSLREGQEQEQEKENAQFKDGVLPRINTNDRSRSTSGRRAPPRINTIDRSRSTSGGRAFRTGRVSPAIEPPSPKVSACGFCSGFGKSSKSGRRKPSKRR